MGSCVGKRSGVQINAIVPNKNFGQNNALLDRWSGQQVKILSKKFNEYKTTEGLDFEGFEKLFKDSTYFETHTILNLFNQFALPEFGVINFRNFCVLVAQIFLASKKEKAELIFKIFDKDNDGVWTFEEFKEFLDSYRAYLKLSKKNSEITCNIEPKLYFFTEWALKHLDFAYITKPFEILPSPEKEKSIIYEYLGDIKNRENFTAYLVSTQWWETWKNYVNYGKSPEMAVSLNKSINIGDRPVAVDNKPLLISDSTLKLKPNLKLDRDFIIINSKTWEILQEWYGGGPLITRKYITQAKKLVLELYPPILTIIPLLNNGFPSNSNSSVLQFSQTNTFSEVLESACKALNRPFESSRIWIKSKNSWVIPLLSDSLEKVKVMDEEVLLESIVFDRNKTFWPRDLVKDKVMTFGSNNTATASSLNSEDSKRNDSKKITYSKASKFPGVVGLMNLGNTCYFNCILQALVHTPLLQEFFTTSNILTFMNRNYAKENSLAYELSLLSREMWDSASFRIKPIRLYKMFTSKFDMFEDKQQHDCHEFLSMFLDSLHEELRREGEEGKSTIIIENPENKQVEITESDRQWQLLQGTQGSIITDICAGQTKTTLMCGVCNSKRILFEIFTNLSLPIPIVSSVPLYIVVVPLIGNITRIGVTLGKNAKLSEILQLISNYANISAEKISLAESSLGYNLSFFEDNENNSVGSLGINSKTEIMAFEVRNTVEDCEKMGRKALKFDSRIEIGEQIDVLNGNTWTTGKLLEIRKNFITEYLVEFDYRNPTELKSSSQISQFRSQTSSIGCVACTFLLISTSQFPNRKVLGFPLLLSIGSWYTFEDLHNLAHSTALKLASKETKATTQCFKLLILDPVTLNCALCKGYSGCTGCPLLKNKTEVRSLGQNMKRVCIAAEWNEKFFSADIKNDVSVNNTKEKEKEINKSIDLNSCLDAFTKEEKLDVQCEKCKSKNMKMTMEIWRAPDILIFSLKRFTYSNGCAEKIDNLVNYPFFGFEISPYVKSVESFPRSSLSTSALMNSYDLYAVVLHSGNMQGGHYTTLCKMETENNWILFDDDNTLELNDSPENSNLLSNSYLLFYKRRRFSSSNVINLTYNSI